jgi:hypothetical protein
MAVALADIKRPLASFCSADRGGKFFLDSECNDSAGFPPVALFLSISASKCIYKRRSPRTPLYFPVGEEILARATSVRVSEPLIKSEDECA